MYLPDDRFNTLVAFVEGYNLATDGRFLGGFNRWLQERSFGEVTNYHWQAIVAAIALGIRPCERWRDMTNEGFDARASAELLDQLARFLRTRDHEVRD